VIRRPVNDCEGHPLKTPYPSIMSGFSTLPATDSSTSAGEVRYFSICLSFNASIGAALF
jgi:hypothetical protein